MQALERQGSKVQMVADALEMLGQVWAVRQAAPYRGFGEVGPGSTPSPKPAAGAPAVLQAS